MATPKDGKTIRLLPALRKLNLELTKKVSDGRKSFEAMKFDRLDEFLNSDCKMGLRVLFPVYSYVQCMNTVGVKTRAELEEMWKGCYHDDRVRECVDELLGLEESIQELYEDIDVELQKAENRLAIQNVTKVGDQLPANLSLTNCCSGEVINIESIWKQSKLTLFIPLKFYS